MKIRMGMLRPMKSNDMIRLSLGRPIAATNRSAPRRAIVPRRERRLRYTTRATIANPAGTSTSGISQRRRIPLADSVGVASDQYLRVLRLEQQGLTALFRRIAPEDQIDHRLLVRDGIGPAFHAGCPER